SLDWKLLARWGVWMRTVLAAAVVSSEIVRPSLTTKGMKISLFFCFLLATRQVFPCSIMGNQSPVRNSGSQTSTKTKEGGLHAQYQTLRNQEYTFVFVVKLDSHIL
ncbi:mCG145904, partial [Mus musculus]